MDDATNTFTRGFYNCECGWSGSKLVYFGYDRDDKLLTGHDRHPQLGQGQCPNCQTIFQGCVHPDQYNATRMVTIPVTKDMIRALEEGRKTQLRIPVEDCDPESLGPDPVDRPFPPCGKPGDRLMVRGPDGKILMAQSEEDEDEFHVLKLEIEYIGVDRLCNISPEDIFKEGIQCPYHTYKDPEMTKATGCRGAPSECSGPRIEFHEVWDRDHPEAPWEKSPWVWVITFKSLS